MATITVTAGDGTATSGTFQIANAPPGMFATNAGGLFAGNLLRVQADGTQITGQNYQLDGSQNVIPLSRESGVGPDLRHHVWHGNQARDHGHRRRRQSD